MRKIVVSGNCQMAVIVASLQLIFPHDKIIPLNYISDPQGENLFNYESALHEADFWLVISKDWAKGLCAKLKYDVSKVISFPNLEFRGFHPDLSYIFEPNSKVVSPVYQSSVLVAAFKMGLSKEVAASCFNSSIFEKLGYHDNWSKSIGALKWRFENSDISSDFLNYLRFCHKKWVFMHTINHPHVDCIVWLAKLISLKLGAPRSILDEDISLPDLLSNYVWPIYPSVACDISLLGSFTFIWSNKNLPLQDFIDLNYSQLQTKYSDTSSITAAPYFIELSVVEQVISGFLKGMK
jgi:hypothetical protein